MINFMPEGRCQQCSFLVLAPAATSTVRETAGVKKEEEERRHLKEMRCHSVIFKLTTFCSPISLRERKGLSFSPPTAALTGKDIHLCLNACGKQKCKTVPQCFISGLGLPQEV